MRTVKLAGERVSLAPVEREDAELWARWLNDIEVALPLGDEVYCTITADRMAQDYEGFSKNGDHVYTILLNETGRPIGRCLLFGLNHVDRNTKVGIFIGERDYWNKGYGAEALELLLDICFNLLNLHSVALGAFAYNQRAIACYKKVGFKETGRRREARIVGGKAYDVVLMDILEHEFSASRLKSYLNNIV